MDKDRSQILGVALVVLGGLFLAVQFLDIGGFPWPFLIILPGLLMFFGGFLGNKEAAPMVIPGTIVTTIGVILLAQQLSGRFETWAYAWALIPTAAGVGQWLHGQRIGEPALSREGEQTARVGLIMLAVFGTFFELLIFRGLGLTGRILLPILLIGGGAFLLIRQDRGLSGPADAPQQD